MRVTFAFLFTNLVDDISLGVCFGWLFEMSRKCVNAIDSFCYICGEFTSKTQKVSMTPLVKKAYELYFGCKVGDQDKVWAPHICCKHCAVNLRGWVKVLHCPCHLLYQWFGVSKKITTPTAIFV